MGVLDALLQQHGPGHRAHAADDRAIRPAGDGQHGAAGVGVRGRSGLRRCHQLPPDAAGRSGWRRSFASLLPYSFVKMKRNRRMIKFEEQFPEAIDLLARALRAGHALTTGLSMVGDEMADPVGPEFRLLFDQQNFGMPLPQALKNFADRIPIIDARFFVTAVLTQRDAGGNLSEVLDNLTSIIRDRFRVKRQVRVISAHGRITGWVSVRASGQPGAVLRVHEPRYLPEVLFGSVRHQADSRSL